MTTAAIDTRLNFRKAIAAFRALQANPEDTSKIFVIFRALRGKSGQKSFARFKASATGRAVLADRRMLLNRLTDRAALAALPDGSLGRAYLAFMESENLSADGLVMASQMEKEPMSPDVELFAARMRDAHDLTHILTGYGRDPLGELCLLTFTYRQNGNLGLIMVVAMAWRRLPSAAREAVREAWRHGPQARWLGDQDWEALLARPLAEVRQMLGIMPPVIYPPLAHLRAAR